MTTPEGIILPANLAYCQYVNKSPEQLIGQRFFGWIPEVDRTEVKKHLAMLCQHTPVRTVTHRMTLPNGEVRWQQWNYQALFDLQDCFVNLQGIGRDITFECSLNR